MDDYCGWEIDVISYTDEDRTIETLLEYRNFSMGDYESEQNKYYVLYNTNAPTAVMINQTGASILYSTGNGVLGYNTGYMVRGGDACLEPLTTPGWDLWS
jgi:hypothetical protein